MDFSPNFAVQQPVWNSTEGRRPAQLDAVEIEIGAGVVGVLEDIGKIAAVYRLYARTERDHGRINVVFADAGISQSAPIGAIEEEHSDCAFCKNVKGLVFTLEEALMVVGGTIIPTGSGARSNGFPNLSI